MNVKDRLAAVCICVHDEAVTAFGDAFLCGNVFRGCEHVADQRLIIHDQHVDRVDVLIWDDENMRWRGWVDVAKGGHLFIAMDNGACNITFDDLAKNTIGHLEPPERLWGWHGAVCFTAYYFIIFVFHRFIGLCVCGSSFADGTYLVNSGEGFIYFIAGQGH